MQTLDASAETVRPRVLMIDPIAYAEMTETMRRKVAAIFDLTLLWAEEEKDTYLDRHGAEFVGMIGRSGLTAALLDKLPNLGILAQTGVGLDGLPLDDLRRRKVAVTNGRGSLSDDVADIGIGLMLCVSRDLGWGERHVRSGAWATTRPRLGHTANRRTYGILGLGSIGKTLARRLEGFGGTILYHNRQPAEGVPYEYCPSLIAMAKRADFLFIVVPGGDATRNIVNEDVLRALGPQGVVINIGRGSAIDEEALIRLLAEGALGGAGLDVHLHEPNVNPKLLELDKVVVLPHLGSSTVETRTAMQQLCVDNILAHLAGRPLLTPV